jgi:hypothetical protein
MTAFAALTFIVFTVALMASVWVALAKESRDPLLAWLLEPYADVWSRWIWAVPVRFGRRLWFAVITSAWHFSDPEAAESLAVLVFVSLVLFLVLQFWLRPYKDPRDNWLETACIATLLYAYFVSSLRSRPLAVGPSIYALEAGLVAYVLWRFARRRYKSRHHAQSAASELSVELLEPSEREP